MLHCSDTNPSSLRSDYECYGTFAPHGDPDDATPQHLEHATDYPDGKVVAMRRGFRTDAYQATGVWPAMGEIWKGGLSLCVLAFCGAHAVEPKRTARRLAVNSTRGKAADALFLVCAVGVAIVVLDGVAALLVWLTGLVL
ncbi:hypothetical protein [Streptomyces sp. NPDC047079]|uniref:hypothetical protein n=1 Tax=Streptomyces sp. NPDC047079 TaxID=3154607 RepID=UPI0033F4E268